MNRFELSVLRGIGKKLLYYAYKDPKKNIPRALRFAKKFAGSMFTESTFTFPLDVVKKEKNIWHRYLFDLLDQIDGEFLRQMVLTFAVDCGYVGTRTLRKNREVYQCNIPWVILMDPTSACNLRCKGCWAAEYGHKSNLALDDMRRLIKEAKALGTHFFMFTGGEPLVKKKEVLTLCRENPDCIFLAFTNGTLVDDAFCREMLACKNLTLALSIEGSEETNDARRGDGVYGKVLQAMATLRRNKCLFGISVCYTSQNYEAVTSDAFYDKMIEAGVKFAWYFHYMPVGSDADKSLLLTPKQREHVYRQIRQKRDKYTGKPLFTVDFQNDAEYVGGCIAGGRNYFHVNSEGDIEPCVFIHYSDRNIKNTSVLEALQSPLFKRYFMGQPFNDNMLRPCPMLENPQALRDIVHETNARSTNLLQPEPVDALCAKCDDYAAAWAPAAKRIWEEKARFKPKTQYYRDMVKEKKDED